MSTKLWAAAAVAASVISAPAMATDFSTTLSTYGYFGNQVAVGSFSDNWALDVTSLAEGAYASFVGQGVPIHVTMPWGSVISSDIVGLTLSLFQDGVLVSTSSGGDASVLNFALDVTKHYSLNVSGVATGNIPGVYSVTYNTLVAAVPEPSSVAMIIAGLLAVGAVTRRRRDTSMV